MNSPENKITRRLLKAARKAQKQAYTPYVNYKVGAALLTKSGKIISGFNIQNASSPAGICAEYTAIAHAYAQGLRQFKKILVVTKDGGSPCGICRQVIWELCGDIPIVLVDKNGKTKTTSTGELLPRPFKL